jgi:predicted nucleic acid-binding protein
MIRVVLDTNIIVSALLQPLGPPAQVFLLAISGSIRLCMSGDVYAEYEEVIRRPRLRRDEDLSVWIDYLKGAVTAQTDRLDALLGHSPNRLIFQVPRSARLERTT